MFSLDLGYSQLLLASLTPRKAQRCHYQRRTMTMMRVSASFFSKLGRILATHFNSGSFESTAQINQYSFLQRFA